MKHYSILLLCGTMLFFVSPSFAQLQTCPANINFATGDLSFWSAQTGLVGRASQAYPAPNSGVSTISEYSISATGIQAIASSTTDPYGGFPTVPTINGYAYNYSMKIGSTATSYDLNTTTRNPGGFTRAITYTINVPAGSSTVPYTMTYAYAMVLENGTHSSNEQPLFKATLSTKDSVITCASPQYYLPTDGNTNNNGSGATLDTVAALNNGFANSPVPFLSHAGNNNNNTGTWLYDVWTKGWTEVTFDLSPYRGQQVTLTFEADNCTPGAHFAYAYVALRDVCAGLEISGDPTVCTNGSATYSIPSLANAVYDWQVPAGWTINSGANSNIINVTAGATGGYIIAHEVNGCANLRDTILVNTKPATVPGVVMSNNIVCSGTNSTSLILNGQLGNILNWLYSTDGTTWSVITNTAATYTANNLTTTTQYKAVVQNGSGCRVDTSAGATIVVDPKTIGGALSPNSLTFCAGQNTNSLIALSGNKGSVVNWQVSNDSTNWNNFSPAKTDSTYNVSSINATTYYRAIAKSGVCPADTSTVATIHFINTPFPSATIDPAITSICYGASADLHATITAGTNYTWAPTSTLKNQGNGGIISLPYTINATATPLTTTNYILTVTNAGCPNVLRDTFKVNVMPKIIVFAGKDTSIIADQPMQLNAIANDSTVNQYLWTPSTGLSSTNVKNPTATLNDYENFLITYLVTATNTLGCTGQDDITIRVFKTGADIFVPGAFTPNGDGKNDIIKPICVGIKQLNYFRIYNRWGELVYSTNQMEEGWDGRVRGQLQPLANFVFAAEGIDYTGRKIFKKGNVVLIR